MTFELINHQDITELLTFQPAEWNSHKQQFEFYMDTPHFYPWKLIAEDKIVGMGVINILGKTAWLLHIVVDPNHRKKGYGLELTNFLIEQAHTMGVNTIQLMATDLGEPLYLKAGFKVASEYLFYKQVGRLRNEDHPNIRRFEERDRESILNLDWHVFRENRVQLLEEHLTYCFVYIENEQVLGYSFPTIREGLIVAVTPEAGIALVEKHSFIRRELAFPSDNQTLVDFLATKGNLPYMKSKRMWYGKRLNWQFDCMYNRISGALG